MKYEDEIKDEVTTEETPVEEVKKPEPKRAKKSSDYIATVKCNGSLAVRDGADGEILYTIPEGRIVRVAEESGEWAKIVGYVKKAFLAEK